MTTEISGRSKQTKKIGIIGMVGNLFLFIIKIVISLITKSQSMLADSINSATDILSSLMTFVGGKISGNNSDANHNYGYGKAEYVFSLIISLIMGYLAIKISAEGVTSLVEHNIFEFSYGLVIVCLITICTKFFLYKHTIKIGKETENILILANASDHKSDMLVTASVLVGVLAANLGIYWLDGVVAICIALKILFDATRIFTESYAVLIDKSMSETELNKIHEIIKSFENIDHIDKVTSKAAGKSFVVIIKVSVDGNMTVNESHEIAGKLKAEVMKLKDIYDVVVHINPV